MILFEDLCNDFIEESWYKELSQTMHNMISFVHRPLNRLPAACAPEYGVPDLLTERVQVGSKRAASPEILAVTYMNLLLAAYPTSADNVLHTLGRMKLVPL